jgi:triphosphoribosyl-dephospho-CoA synthase
MAAAAGHDRIARAYATDFEDLSAVGLPALNAARRDGLADEWLTLAVYLAFLAAFPDTHIARKHGPDVAEAVRREAEALRRSEPLSAQPLKSLLRFDRDLKERRLNPGTSGDFTVATLFADRLKSPADDHLRLVGR